MIQVDFDTRCDLSLMDELEKLARKKHPGWDLRRLDKYNKGEILALYHNDKLVCDVICHFQSLGGTAGKLEYWNGLKKTEPIGFISSAERALELFESNRDRFPTLF